MPDPTRIFGTVYDTGDSGATEVTVSRHDGRYTWALNVDLYPDPPVNPPGKTYRSGEDAFKAARRALKRYVQPFGEPT